jgi:spectinomycin phosphotransferase
MREPPAHVADSEVLDVVRRAWDPDVDMVEHLPVGFGAHHWAARSSGEARLFVTYDHGKADPLTVLEAAYAGARALRDDGLEFVLAPLLARSGRVTERFARGALSCSTWLDGTSSEPLDVPWTTAVLRRLHATGPPPAVPRWQPRVEVDLPAALAQLIENAWGPGPHAGPARDAVRRRLDAIERWTERYHRLADAARDRPWVVTHGEPHHANQLLTSSGRFLVDWDTLRLAPAEVDLQVLVDAGLDPAEAGADPEMLELFDLEWRLDEISQYAAWFSAPHGDSEDDRIAFDGLLHELTRPT